MLLLILLINIPNLPSLCSSFHQQKVNKKNYKLLSFNKYERNTSIIEFLKNLKKIDTDFTVLQEVSDPGFILNDSKLSKIYPFHFFSPKAKKLILSKYKIYDDSYNENGFQITSIKLPAKKLSIVNVHLPKLFMNKKSYESSVNTLLSTINTLQGAVLLVGDFNITPYDALYRTITKEHNFNDSFKCTGSGLGFTFPSSARSKLGLFGKLFRIDYIFGRNIHFLNAKVIDNNSGSDHFPIMTSFIL